MSELLQVKPTVEKPLKASDILIGAYGEVKQIVGCFKNKGGYCAMGVLAFNAGIPMIDNAVSHGRGDPYDEVEAHYGLSFALTNKIERMNDDGKSFKEIGEWLKEQGY